MPIFDKTFNKTPAANKEVKNTILRNTTLTKDRPKKSDHLPKKGDPS